MNDARNTCGQAYALTVLTPIIRGHDSRLAYFLDSLSGEESPLAHVPGTHFARWVVIGDVVYEGGGQRRDHLQAGRLLFSSNFDGPLAPYLEAMRVGLGAQADAIWGHCEGYPGSAEAGAFARYIRAHQVENALFYSAYGDRTVEMVTRSLERRHELIAFALRAQGMASAELQVAFREAFAG